MHTAANPAYRPGVEDTRAFNRALAWSIAAHVGVVLFCVVVPREWISTRPKPLMTITLGGTPGPRSTGTTSIGGRTIEEVAPPPKRPEPIRPTPKAEPDPVPVKTPPQTAKPSRTTKPDQTATRTPTTGRQVMAGSTPVDTGARGQGAGLTFGGGGTGGETNLADFCCKEYLHLLTTEIDSHWVKQQPVRGTTIVRFTILRSGQIADVEITRPSGSSLLDRASQRALFESRLPPLPPQYQSDKLTVNLTFPYEGH
jgi:TonB family protein